MKKQNNPQLSEKWPVRKAKAYWHMLGPGLTTGAADDDPSGIATYSQAGSQYGFTFLWLAVFTFPLMAIVQEMCARIGMVTGRGLAANIRRHFPKWVLYTCAVLLFIANSFNIGADLGAMAKATQLLIPGIPFVFLVILFTLASLFLQIFTTYQRYARYLKYLALILFSYVLTALIVKFNGSELLFSTFIPHFNFSKQQLFILTGILGTTISPYLFFWQTSQEVEEQILGGHTTIKSRQGSTDQEVTRMRVDVWSGMFISNLVMFCIIAVSAVTLFTHGITNIQTAADAAAALRPLAGDQAYLLFTLGIIGTGLLAVPVLAGSASYAISESFGWHEGLYRKFKQAHAFYGIIIVSMIVGLLLNFVGLHPIRALIYSAVVNGLVAPIVLVIIMLMAGNKKIVGQRTNKPITAFFGWLITGVMAVCGAATIVSFIFF